MQNTHIITIITLVLTFLLGAGLTGLGLIIQGKIAKAKTACSRNLVNANSALLVLAISMTTMAFTMLYYMIAESQINPGSPDELPKFLLVAYAVWAVTVSIVCTVLGSILFQHDHVDPHCNDIRDSGKIVMGIGIAGCVVMTGAVGAYTYANRE